MVGKSFNLSLPGIGSYSGRYAYFAAVCGLVLMGAAYLGWNHVTRTGRQQISQIEKRAMTARVLDDVQNQLNLLENRLQKIVIQSDKGDREALALRVRRLGYALRHLRTALRQQGGSDLVLAEALQEDGESLGQAAQELFRIRTNDESWFPALRLMREEMLPHNQQLLGLLDQLLQESEDEEIPLATRLRVLQLVTSLRKDWLNMIAEMRLFVANRFGIFSNESSQGMHSRLLNVRIYADELPKYLTPLRRLARKQELGFIGEEFMDAIDSHQRAWLEAFTRLEKLLESPDWRRDLVLMRESIAPVVKRMRERISTLDTDLGTQSARDITHLAEITRQLSKSILSLAVAGILLILFAYLFLRRNLLRPIAETALALKQEAQGMVDIAPPPASLRETRDLVEAFTEMRKQVHTRQRSLDHMAHHDALTQLPNRLLFRDRLQHALELASRGDHLVGLMFLDLDRFKQINDSLGHLVGDELLKLVAERLQGLVRSSDTVARLSGDEFAILVEGLEEQEDMVPLAEKALSMLERPMWIAGQELRISASIGIALAPFDDITTEHLIRDADAAMYQAKREGRAAYRFFSNEMTHRASESLHLENEIYRAVEAGEFLFHFQPVVRIGDGRLDGCEALLRWNHPRKGLLSPEVFLDTLNSTGLISAIMENLLDQAEAQQRALSIKQGYTVGVSVNLSVRLLNDPTFCRALLERLVAGQFADGGLVLEITEDILTQELAEAEVFLQQVKTLGGRIALDDFGTGQASLSHLRQFPFDLLKIDRAFIRDVNTDPNNASLVQAIIQLAHAFGMRVVAEGVETQAQRDYIQGLECDYIQGYLVGAPQPSGSAGLC